MNEREEVFVTNNFEETRKLGEEFVARLHLEQGVTLSKATVIALYGDLGSGKTTFVQGMAKGLGIKRRIISPTFIIIRSYNIKYPHFAEASRGWQISNIKYTNKKLKMFYHIDLYRIESEKDVKGLGIKEILKDPQNIVVIEWAEKMGNLLPKNRINIYFEYLGYDMRRITIKNS